MFRNNDKTESRTIRFTKDQVDFLEKICKVYGFTISDYIRMIVNHQKFIFENKEKERNEYK